MTVQFCVVNPGGHDPDRHFPNGAGRPGDPGHPPVNHHAYAACMRGSFLASERDVPPGVPVVLLLRPRHLRRGAEALRRLQGSPVFIAWKEAGTAQVAAALDRASRWRDFSAIASAGAGAIAATEELVPLYKAAGCQSVHFIPTPYPVGEPGWDFSRGFGERLGIFVATREFAVPARNHLLALASAAETGLPVTVVNIEGARGRSLVRAVTPRARVVEGPLPYPEYLALMASHRVVFQLDAGAVPGQVAGDALLTGTPCVGGNGAINRLAFPDSSGLPAGRSAAMAAAMHHDEAAWHAHITRALSRASERVSFAAVAARLAALPGLTPAASGTPA